MTFGFYSEIFNGLVPLVFLNPQSKIRNPKSWLNGLSVQTLIGSYKDLQVFVLVPDEFLEALFNEVVQDDAARYKPFSGKASICQ
jgi:hypothetical protein